MKTGLAQGEIDLYSPILWPYQARIQGVHHYDLEPLGTNSSGHAAIGQPRLPVLESGEASGGDSRVRTQLPSSIWPETCLG